jgi:aldose 1-epimerase
MRGKSKSHRPLQNDETETVQNAHIITISDGSSICSLCPDIGGSIVSWTVDGQHMLRTPEVSKVAALSPIAMASFPLVPYSNRIGYGRFEWDGKPVLVTPNFHPEPHSIHGVGWTQAWRIETLSKHRCSMSMVHNADENWPWSFSAMQCIELNNGALSLFSCATNLSDNAAPLAFGHHPYFDQDGASLQFQANSVLVNADDGLPLEALPPLGHFDFSELGKVSGRDIDNCYADWAGTAKICWEGRALALEISANLNTAVLYIPNNSDRFCFEPVPHVNNALNRPDLKPAMPIVEPGSVFEAIITLQSLPA